MKKIILIAAISLAFIGCEKRGGGDGSVAGGSGGDDGMTAEERAEVEAEQDSGMSAEEEAQMDKEMSGQ
ncbi:hypothetical protein N9B94_00645 [Verrucomicrobia bacterium]|nr:hypothetical protein [Verrucomicrobiota bacterium]